MNLAKKYPPSYTYEDYRLWEGDWELIEGVPYAMAPSPFGRHQRVVGKLIYQLAEQLENYQKTSFLCTYIKEAKTFRLLRSRYRKFFDSDEGSLELKIKDCTLKVDVGRLW